MAEPADVNNSAKDFAQKLFSDNRSIVRFQLQKIYYSSCFISEFGIFLLGDDKGTLDIYQNLNENPIKTINAHQCRIHYLVYNSERKALISASVDGTLVSWSVEYLTPLYTNSTAVLDTIISIIISPLGDKIIVATENGWIKMFDNRLNEIQSQKLADSITNMILTLKKNILIISSPSQLWFMDAVKGKIISTTPAPVFIDKLITKEKDSYNILSVHDSKLIENLVYNDIKDSKIYRLKGIDDVGSQNEILSAIEIKFMSAILITTNISLGLLFPLIRETFYLELVSFEPSFPRISSIHYNESYRVITFSKLDKEIVLIYLNSRFNLLQEYLKNLYIETEMHQFKITPMQISLDYKLIPGVQRMISSLPEPMTELGDNKLMDSADNVYFDLPLVPNFQYFYSSRNGFQKRKSAKQLNENDLIAPFLVSYDKILPFRQVKLAFPIEFNIFGFSSSIYSINLQNLLMKTELNDGRPSISTKMDSRFSNLFFDDIQKNLVVFHRDLKAVEFYQPDSLSLLETFKHSINENDKIFYSCERMLYDIEIFSESGAIIHKILISNSLTFRKIKCNFRIKRILKMPYSSAFYAISEEKELFEISLLKNSIVKLYRSRESLNDLDISPLGDHLLAYSANKIYIFKLIDRSLMKSIDFERSLIKNVFFAYNSDYLIILDVSNRYAYYSISQDKLIIGGMLPSNFVNSVVLTTSRIIASLSADSGSIMLWDPYIILNNDSISLYNKNFKRIEKSIQDLLNNFLECSKKNGYEFALENYHRNISHLYYSHSEVVVYLLDQCLRKMMVKIEEIEPAGDSKNLNQYIFQYKGIFHLIESLEILELFPLVFQMSNSDILMLKCFSFLIFQPFEAMLGKKLDLKPLIQSMDEKDPALFIVLIEIIQKYKDGKYYYLIEKGIFDNNDDVKIKAIKAALQIGFNQFALVLQKDLESSNQAIKKAVLEYLTEFGSSVHFEKIIEAIVNDANNGQSLEMYAYILPKLMKKYPKFLLNLDLAANSIVDKKNQIGVINLIKKCRDLSI